MHTQQSLVTINWYDKKNDDVITQKCKLEKSLYLFDDYMGVGDG